MANLPDLAHSATLSTLTQSHNQGVRRSLKVLSQQHLDLQIVILDANALYRKAITSPAKFGFTKIISACVFGSGTCGSSDQFFFWDGIHPTTAVHRVLAEQSFAELESGLLI